MHKPTNSIHASCTRNQLQYATTNFKKACRFRLRGLGPSWCASSGHCKCRSPHPAASSRLLSLFPARSLFGRVISYSVTTYNEGYDLGFKFMAMNKCKKNELDHANKIQAWIASRQMFKSNLLNSLKLPVIMEQNR